jgi:O-antigen/teichoic acid export membrane protein
MRNYAWSLAGLAIPLLVAALTVPHLIDQIGPERFGLLALAWGLVGYAGILDLGVGRAVTQRLSSLRMSATEADLRRVLEGAISVTKISGAIGCLILLGMLLFNFEERIAVGSIAPPELRWSLLVVAAILPVQAVSATYRGVNEAYLNFKGISIVRVALGVANFGGPYLASLWTQNLSVLIGTLLLSRILGFVAFRRLALSCLPARAHGAGATRGGLADGVALLRFGGWVTVSNVISPLLVQSDRFFVGAMISATAVTAYVLPFEMVVQCLILVSAVTSVLFPKFSVLLSQGGHEINTLYRTWMLRMAVGMFVVMAIVAMLLPAVMTAWLGDRVTSESVLVGRILCIGVWLNAIGSVSFALLHAQGNARITALAHLCETPVYLCGIYLGIGYFGITGAAVAWVCRAACDTAILCYFASKKR